MKDFKTKDLVYKLSKILVEIAEIIYDKGE